jgi:hypothetical protein
MFSAMGILFRTQGPEELCINQERNVFKNARQPPPCVFGHICLVTEM